VSALEQLPNRRVEGWRWSDLRAALGQREPLLGPAGRDVLARLAEGAGALETVHVRAGEQRGLIARLGAGPYDASALDVVVEPSASFSLVTLQDGGDVTLSHRKVRVGDGAQFRQFVLALGGRFARTETEVLVEGAGASVELSGVYLAGAGRHADQTSRVELNAEGAQVRQLVRGVARKGGRGVFQGKFKVERPAQKADAEMEHNALLLEDGAEVFAKPELEIYADDVQCSHGNTIGQIDEQAVFYLRSRGVPEAQARAMITRAFLVGAIPEWIEDDLRDEIEARVDAWLGGENAPAV
jgi:Fe-S cluster assembly protein SufD